MKNNNSVLILNGSPKGRKSNSQILIRKFKNLPKSQIVHLADIKWTALQKKKLFAQINQAEGFIFVTGTYWDSWGSPLQEFLENVTELEGTSALLGKPAVVIVLNHSVGGKSVLSRLQAVLSTLGCLIPPMSGMVYSWTTDQMRKSKTNKNLVKDLWTLDDLGPIFENLKLAMSTKIKWQSWDIDRKDYKKVWL